MVTKLFKVQKTCILCKQSSSFFGDSVIARSISFVCKKCKAKKRVMIIVKQKSVRSVVMFGLSLLKSCVVRVITRHTLVLHTFENACANGRKRIGHEFGLIVRSMGERIVLILRSIIVNGRERIKNT